MEIIPIVEGACFDDETTRAMGEAFDHACKSLGSFGDGVTVREKIAKQIIKAATNGERNRSRLYEQALQAVDVPVLVVSGGRDLPIPACSVTHAA